jgi:hypothetical protein
MSAAVSQVALSKAAASIVQASVATDRRTLLPIQDRSDPGGMSIDNAPRRALPETAAIDDKTQQYTEASRLTPGENRSETMNVRAERRPGGPRILSLAMALALGGLAMTASPAAAQTCSDFTVTKNVYKGSDWWGTVTFMNNGPSTVTDYVVQFDVPSGVHCTNDYVPPGATLSPLNGTGSTARTVSNHCVFTWSNAPSLAVGSSKTFNYSTDSQGFSSASKLSVTTMACQSAATSTFALVTNSYDGPNWWGTIKVVNNGPFSSSSYRVEFDVPSGSHCTAEPESIPPGATLSPLTGTGSAARTVSNHCVFTWANPPLLPVGGALTFNYSTDTQAFNKALNVAASDIGRDGCPEEPDRTVEIFEHAPQNLLIPMPVADYGNRVSCEFNWIRIKTWPNSGIRMILDYPVGDLGVNLGCNRTKWTWEIFSAGDLKKASSVTGSAVGSNPFDPCMAPPMVFNQIGGGHLDVFLRQTRSEVGSPVYLTSSDLRIKYWISN